MCNSGGRGGPTGAPLLPRGLLSPLPTSALLRALAAHPGDSRPATTTTTLEQEARGLGRPQEQSGFASAGCHSQPAYLLLAE